MQLAAILPALDNAVIWAGGDKQDDSANEQPQPDPIDISRVLRKLREPFAEHSTKAKAEQDLRPENKDPGFLERDLDLL